MSGAVAIAIVACVLAAFAAMLALPPALRLRRENAGRREWLEMFREQFGDDAAREEERRWRAEERAMTSRKPKEDR